MNNIDKSSNRKINLCFFTLSLFPVLSFVSVIPSYLFSLLLNKSDYRSNFYLGFVLPQLIYSLIGLSIFLLLTKHLGCRVSKVVSVNKTSRFFFFLYVPILLLINLFCSFSVNILLDCLSNVGIKIFAYSSFIYIPKTPFQVFLFFVTVAIIPSLSEELIFRGILVEFFKEYGTSNAIVFSSIAFALVHSTVQQIPTAFFVGMFLAYIYIECGSIIPCILGHLVTNIISAVFMIIPYITSESICNDIYFFINLILVITGIFSAILFFFRRTKDRKTDRKIFNSLKSPKNTLNNFFSSVGFWIFCLIMIGQTVFYAVVLSGQG